MGRRLHGPAIATSLVVLLALPSGRSCVGQISKVPEADSSRGNFFGAAVAMDGDRLLIGASGADACGPSSGAAFVYARTESGAWAVEQRLTADDCAPEEYFGKAVSLDGDVAVVTSFIPSFRSVRSNAVYVFERSPEGWVQTGRLTGEGDSGSRGPFAASVSVDGGRILVTSAGDTSSGRFGGAATLFEKNAAGRWVVAATMKVTHDARLGVFGTSCVLQGGRAVVTGSTYGLNSPGTAHVFEEREDSWELVERIEGVDDYFMPVDLDGDRLIIGQTRDGQDHTGRAVIYERKGSRWVRSAELKPDSPYPSGGFGSDVAISGDTAVAVGFDEQLKLEFNIDRVVFVFHRSEDGRWRQTRIVDVGEVYFGAAVDLQDDTAVIGQASEGEPGAVYVAGVR